MNKAVITNILTSFFVIISTSISISGIIYKYRTFEIILPLLLSALLILSKIISLMIKQNKKNVERIKWQEIACLLSLGNTVRIEKDKTTVIPKKN